MNSIFFSIRSALRTAIRSPHSLSARLGTRHIKQVGSKSGWVQALRDTRLISERKAWAKSTARRPGHRG
jgi:hypothetical protein